MIEKLNWILLFQMILNDVIKKILLFFHCHILKVLGDPPEAIKIKLEPKYRVTAFGHVVNDLLNFIIEVLEKKVN